MLQFVLIGLALCLFSVVQKQRHDARRIVVTPLRVAQITRKYALQFGAPPDAATLERLVGGDIHDEVLFREGMALKLDRDDEIVRRRIVQKARFLLEAGAAPREPTDADLRAYADAHLDRYLEPARVSFSHIFFKVDRLGDAVAQATARGVLARLPASTTRAPQTGDPYPDLYDFSAQEPEQVARLFGRTPFASAVALAPAGRWTGPFRSAYGWHLLRVSTRAPARRPPLDEIAQRVRANFLEDAQARADQAVYARLASRYTVVRADRGDRP